MFRSQFSKKTPNPVRTGNFKKGATAAAPASKPATRTVKAAPKVVKKALSIAKSHAGSINNSNIRMMNYSVSPVGEGEGNEEPIGVKKTIHIYFYDNLQSFPLDYVKTSEEESVAPGFNMRSLIPLYEATNNAGNSKGGKNPHLDALQDMFDDMIIAGGFKTTNPNLDDFKNGACPADRDPTNGDSGITTYECVLHSETRTFITQDTHKGEGNDDKDYLNMNYNIISQQINNEDNHPEGSEDMRTQDAWIGFYRDSNAEKPTFLKLKIVRYDIGTLYAGYGTVENGVMKKVTEDAKRACVEIMPEKVYITPTTTAVITPFENAAPRADTTIVVTNIYMIKGDGDSPYDQWRYRAKWNKLSTDPNGGSGDDDEKDWSVNAIPGYEILPIFEGDDLKELQSRPISVDLPELMTSQLRQEDSEWTSVPVGSKVARIPLYSIIPTNDDSEDETPEGIPSLNIKLCTSSWMEKEGEEGAQDDVVAYVQRTSQPELLLMYELEDADVVDGIITKDKSAEISKYIKSIDGALIKGPILVKGSTNSPTVKLQFLEGVTFTNCTFQDPDEELSASNWFWLYNNTFENCDMQMKAYADIKDHLQIVGKANRKGDKGMNEQGRITSVDDLYAYVSSGNITVEGQTAEDNPYIFQHMNFKYTPKSEESLPKIEYDEESNNTHVYGPLEQFKEEPPTCLYSPISLYYEVSTKPTNIPESVEDAYIELDDTSSTKLVNTYYGLCGNVEADKLQKIYHKVNQVGISEDATYGYKYDMDPVDGAAKEELMGLITRWKYIASVIPINWRYLSELSDLLGKIVAFEENRMPSPGEGKLDTVVENNLVLVEEAGSTVVKGPITYHYSQGSYKWDENGTHAQMASKLATLHSMMYTNMQQGAAGEATPEDAANVATRLYTLTDLFLKTWEDYYKIGDNGQTISLTTELLDAGEFEIYEVEGIYETFIQSESDLLVAPKAENTDDNRYARTFMDIVISVDEIKKLINEAAKQEEEKEYVIDSVRLYKNPIYKPNENENNANNILEYGQFLATIQSRRNLIQQGGDEVLVKFTQTERGTFFEILGKEPESSSADAYEGAVAGFFISKGYQGKVAEGQKTQKPSIPRGRYDRKVRRSVIPAKSVAAAPEPRGENGEEWRITIVPKFYEGEPLDWTKDNYYTTFLFAQNADNLNMQLDPEFEARNKVVFTPGTGDNEPERLEEQMIGYFVAIPKPDPEPNP